MESIKKLKASMQLAEMRFKSESSESNLSIFQLAKSAYDNAVAPLSKHPLIPEPILTGNEAKVGAKLIDLAKVSGLGKAKVEKIEQVSGETKKLDLPEGTDKTGDASGTLQPSEPVEKTAEPETEKESVDPIAENVEPISEPVTEEKKTAESQEPQS